jgi:hypothetical protein
MTKAEVIAMLISCGSLCVAWRALVVARRAVAAADYLVSRIVRKLEAIGYV